MVPQHWFSTFGAECECLACSSLLLAYALRGFGLWLYASGAPRHWLTDAINFVGARWPERRTMLGPAWQVNRAWAQAEPGRPRVVIPASLLRAMFGISLLWGWPRFAGLVFGFCSMLRPDEFLSASRGDLVLPSDRPEVSGDAFLQIAEARTRRFMRHQHARISDAEVVQFLEVIFGLLGRHEPLAPYGAASFRSRWNAMFLQLGVPSHVATSGPKMGSLRGSGATEVCFQTEDVPRIAWRGRWRKAETPEHYFQEARSSPAAADRFAPGRPGSDRRSRSRELAAARIFSAAWFGKPFGRDGKSSRHQASLQS